MYLAPLNYDRYFKKAFSDPDTAKAFLEDFFDVTIESIELLSPAHKVTNDAAAVEFDFRCKIDGRFVIVDMQQWHKPNIVHRFYVYHCISTALQMETLPIKSIVSRSGKARDERDYADILPVITLVWMADDTLGFKEDSVAFTMLPETVSALVRDGDLWENPNMAALLARRELALAQLSNKTKKLGFLQENRLIYAFQKNILANNAEGTGKKPRYMRWFTLAEKSKNKDNQKSDFAEYESERTFATLLRRLGTEDMSEDDLGYIDGFGDLLDQIRRWSDEFYQDGIDVGREQGLGLGREEGREEGIGIGVELGYEKALYETAKTAILEGLPNEIIKKLTKLSDDQINVIRKGLENAG